MTHVPSHRCYAKGCRRPECKKAHAIYMREYRQNRTRAACYGRATGRWTPRTQAQRERRNALSRAKSRLAEIYPTQFATLVTDELGETA